MSTEQNTLLNLLPTGKLITLSTGREQLVKPFKFRQFGQVMAILRAIKFNVLDDELDLAGLAAEHYDEVLQVVKIATGWAQEEVDELYSDDVSRLVLAIIEVNKDFFVQRLLPALEEAKKTSPGQP